MAKPDCTLEDAVENIDIGGPTMVRSAAKNHAHVGIVTNPSDYARVLAELESNHGELSLEQLGHQRPVPGWAHHRTPLRDLWLCGSGTHPGGGIMGAPGALAARAMLGGRIR